MSPIGKWLLQDEQKEIWEIIFAAIANPVFLALSALALWPVGKPMLAWTLAEGSGALWLGTILVTLVLHRIHAAFKVNLYDRADAFVVSNLAVSCALQVGWSAFAAAAVHAAAAGAGLWPAVLLYGTGVLSCLVAFWVVSAFYPGHLYRMVSLPLAVAGFTGFSAWLALAHR